MKRRLAVVCLAAACGCASRDAGPAPEPAADRVADFAPLRIGQPFLGGALEVTRLRKDRDALAVSVSNRTGAALRLRWRFRYVDAEGWERRTRDSAAWRDAEIEAGAEWRWEGEPEVPGAASVGMDWRYGR